MEFEHDIIQIENKILELKNFAKEMQIDLTEEIARLNREKEEKLKEIYSNLTSWDKVFISRHPKRLYTMDYIEQITTNFVELHGDRLFREDPAIVGGFCKLEGRRIMVVGHQKGRTTDEKLFRNFGMANPEGYRKALRLFKLADRFRIPIVTFIDTPGAYPGIEAEEHGQGEAIARNLMEMSGLRVPMISVVIGEGGSGGALGLGVTNRILMLEHSVYSVISPEGCAAILYKDASKASEAAENLKISAQDLLTLGVIDRIIPEPVGGVHRNPEEAAENVKKALLETLDGLCALTEAELMADRYQKFRNIGFFLEGQAKEDQ
ncbi:MAG: acetyl-CoA carboxylase carboxyltransferase subunit alpha [Fusobacteriaceae bacterium]|jgi:acetyl-CoA carboxylase carboxyl transferase subunit alpha|nr:acetyl-CoA carboxylase carboxyltransferase subunit alpha [Fusobacteriaceae bacterium]